MDSKYDIILVKRYKFIVDLLRWGGMILYQKVSCLGPKELILSSTSEEKIFAEKTKIDKWDYLIATCGGVVGGLIDAFLVGAPGDSVLGNWTDAQVDKVVTEFAKFNGWKPQEAGGVDKAIAFLEKRFKVNYDQSVSSAASEVFGITPRNHHMKSLAHSPDILGLFFSILNQFTSTSTFISDGRLITMDTETFELAGGNFVAKIFCGFYNWIGHLMSDVAGSSSAKGRGAGIVMPFYELFQLFDFGNFNLGKEKGTLADVATKAFEQGYDARFGLTMTIPVIITDLVIRLIWSLRRLIQYKAPLKECIPFSRHRDLRIMLLVGNGALCVIDAVDAGVRAGGVSVPAFVVRLNMVAWAKMVKLAIREVFIISGAVDIDMAVEAIRETDSLISEYLENLKQIDIEAFEKEVKEYESWSMELEAVTDDIQLNHFLLKTYEKMNIELPWTGDFDEFFSNKENKLVFR